MVQSLSHLVLLQCLSNCEVSSNVVIPTKLQKWITLVLTTIIQTEYIHLSTCLQLYFLLPLHKNIQNLMFMLHRVYQILPGIVIEQLLGDADMNAFGACAGRMQMAYLHSFSFVYCWSLPKLNEAS